MKTSIIDVPDLLSVLSVDELEKRISEVPGVESATVNYAAKNVTVRYDETLLDVADIKVLIHQRGKQSADQSNPSEESEDKPDHHSEEKTDHKPAETPIADAASGSASPPKPAAQ